MLKIGATRCAKDLRTELQRQAKMPHFIETVLPQLIVALRAAEWPELELEKLRAYVDFFSGANAQGYRRVLDAGLVHDDYTLFMTACVHCYLADRFTEGAALLDMFNPHEDNSTDWPEYLAYAGYIHFAAGRPITRALECFDQALAADYFSPLLAVNAYSIYFEAGRLAECNKLRSLIQRHCPHDPDAQYALACVELARNFYPEGFRLLEARLRMPELDRFINASLLTQPRWEKQSLAGKRLLVHGEQGLGDMVMMVRYLPQLHAQGAHLVVDTRAEAIALLADNFPYCKFIVGDIKVPINEPFDFWIGIMSLPFQFQSTADNIPAVEGYLSAPAEQVSYWRERICKAPGVPILRVGLAWSGNPGHRADKRRSMSFDLISGLIRKHPDVLFFSLQTHAPEVLPFNLVDLGDELLTIADTAAVIAEMDLVMSVDTSAIHMAGALGRPAWLLLPYRYEWRWGLEGLGNAWYNSVSVWRQPSSGDWSALLNVVDGALQNLKSTKA